MKKQIQTAASFLASFEIWLVGLTVVAGIASGRALPIAVAVGGIFWPIRWLATGKWSIRTPADWGIALLLLMLPITLWATALPDTTRPNVYRLLAGIALYYAVVNWTISHGRVRLLINGTVLAGLFLALSAPITVKWKTGKFLFIPTSLYERFPPLLSDTLDPNLVAGSLVVLLPCAITMLLFAWRNLRLSERLLAMIAILAMISILVLSQSRGALIGLAAALGVMVLLYWRWSWWPFFALGAIGAFMAWYQGIVILLNTLTSSNTEGSFAGRLEVWSRTFHMIQDFAFTGIGIGTFGPILDAMYPLFLATPGSVPHTHNLFLQVAVDVGLPGLIGWLAILILVLMGAWQLYRYGRITGNGWIAGLGAGLLCSQVAMMVHGLTDAVTWATSRPSPIVWAMWGLTIAAWRVLVVQTETPPIK